MLPPKITLISAICSSPLEISLRRSLDDALPDEDLEVLVLLVAASFYDPERFCTLLDHVHRYDGSRTTFLHHRGVRRVSSPSDLRIISHGIGDLCGPSDLLGKWC
jgi:hypothetical protein